jgi:transposase, IS5 family
MVEFMHFSPCSGALVPQRPEWRTGCEGRISVIKRRHGLNRCCYKGDAGMKRWVGLGVIAHNVINIGNAMEKQSHM